MGFGVLRFQIAGRQRLHQVEAAGAQQPGAGTATASCTKKERHPELRRFIKLCPQVANQVCRSKRHAANPHSGKSGNYSLILSLLHLAGETSRVILSSAPTRVRLVDTARDLADVNVTEIDVPTVLAFGIATAGEGGMMPH